MQPEKVEENSFSGDWHPVHPFIAFSRCGPRAWCNIGWFCRVVRNAGRVCAYMYVLLVVLRTCAQSPVGVRDG